MLHLQFNLAGQRKWQRTYYWNMRSCWGRRNWTVDQQMQQKESQISKNNIITLCKTPRLPASKNTTRKVRQAGLLIPCRLQGLQPCEVEEPSGSFVCPDSKQRDKGIQTRGEPILACPSFPPTLCHYRGPVSLQVYFTEQRQHLTISQQPHSSQKNAANSRRRCSGNSCAVPETVHSWSQGCFWLLVSPGDFLQ